MIGWPVMNQYEPSSSCLVCNLSGPPSDKSGHRCFICGTPVHSFGCSLPREGGEEGFGGTDRVCLPCSQKNKTPTSAPKQQICTPTAKQQVSASTSQPSKKRRYWNRNDVFCVVCALAGASAKCCNCGVSMHEDKCSIQNFPSDARFCMNCYCLSCKHMKAANSEHHCICHICKSRVIASEGHICFRCERITHFKCCSFVHEQEKGNDKMSICDSCLLARTTGVSSSMRTVLEHNEMLTDEHMARASLMLAAQYGKKVDGLCAPLAVTYGEKVDDVNYYPRLSEKNYVQIMYDGRHHWVTAVFKSGSGEVTILDSLRKNDLSGLLKIQVCMVMMSDSQTVTVKRPMCKQQTNQVDCGLFAIANAVEFCHTSQLCAVDYNPSEMRAHFLKCLMEGHLSPFPRLSRRRPKKPFEDDDMMTFNVYCSCRLPGSYDNLVCCDQCEEWYHYSCVGLRKGPSKEWLCLKCKN